MLNDHTGLIRLMTGVGLGALALGLPSAALAQGQSDAAASVEAEAPKDSGGVEEIIVTAQKREERSLTVPIAISALSSRALETQGVTSTATLAASVPGLQINRSLNSATPFLRGVGNPSGAVGEEGATAIYIDGVYNPNQYANLFEFNNIERIEVLKGPQGTLFGRNSAAGAILVTTKAPSHKFGMNAFTGYGNFNTFSGGAYVTGGLTDNLAANLAVQFRDQQDGWGKNLTTGGDNGLSRYWSARGKLLWNVSARTTVTLAGDYYRQKESLVGHPIVKNIFGYSDPGFWNSLNNLNNSTDLENYGASLRVEHEADPFRIISMTGYRHTKSVGYFDFDASPLSLVAFTPLVPKDESISQEFQLTSNPGSSIKWVAGVFLYYDKAGYYPFMQQGLGTPATSGGFVKREDAQTTNSYAGFAQATVPVIRNTNLTLGVRYSLDDRSLEYTQTSSSAALNVGTRGPIKVSYPKTTFRVSLDHQFNRDFMVYASFNTGFKSGLFNLNTPTDPAVHPETITAYEAGFKAKVLDGRLQLEGAGFHYDFSDIQLRRVLTGGGTQLLNAASARINGLDLSLQAVPVDNLNLNASLSLLDTKFTSFPNAPATVPLPATALAGGVCPTSSSGPATGGNLVCIVDATGNHLTQAPPVSANFGASYSFDLAGGTMMLSGAYSYTSSFNWEADNRLKEPEHHIVRASIGWKAPDDRWQIRFWGQNLTNEKRTSLTSSNGSGDTSVPAEPRTYGVTVSVKFGD